MDTQKGQWRSLGEGGGQRGDNEWDEDNSEEHGKLGRAVGISYDPKAVAAREKTIINSLGHQPRECDA